MLFYIKVYFVAAVMQQPAPQVVTTITVSTSDGESTLSFFMPKDFLV
jgi:hypothetical protein